MSVARPGKRYARTGSVSPDELRRIPLVLRENGSGALELISAAPAKAGVRTVQLRTVMRLGTTEGIKAFVRHSDAPAIVPVISVVERCASSISGGRRGFSLVLAEAEPAGLVHRFMEFADSDRSLRVIPDRQILPAIEIRSAYFPHPNNQKRSFTATAHLPLQTVRSSGAPA